MTTDELQIILDVLDESSRLSKSDARALTAEVARRTLLATPTIVVECRCHEVPDRHWYQDEGEAGHLRSCHYYAGPDADVGG